MAQGACAWWVYVQELSSKGYAFLGVCVLGGICVGLSVHEVNI